ncbi:MAG: Spy/CpxP family protein refolding chaperone [Acidobacteriota bacterium]|nr:Spy/CpxP family protein refolding chaperone [Acidobacteriota bacterium]
MKKIIIGFTVFTLVAISTIFAVAQKNGGAEWQGKRGGHHHRGHRGGFGMMAEKLGLTDAQKAQVKDIMEAGKAKTQPLREARKANRQKMDAATADGQFDEAQVTAIAQEQAMISAQMIVEKERVKAQMFQVLTAEQKAQMAQLKDQMKEHFQNRRHGREKKAEQNDDSSVQ